MRSNYLDNLFSTGPAHLIPDKIPYDKITIGPAFPSMGSLIMDFPTYDLAMKISVCLEQSPSQPKIVMLPTIYVSNLYYVLCLIIVIAVIA